MDTKGLQEEFVNWCRSNKKQPKSKEETQQLFVTFMKEKHPEEYKAAIENQQKQAKKAAHGAKLNYFKSLKNQCAEDEEVVYYKKGGSVGCGCKKKEDGGSIEKKDSTSNNAVKAFKLKQKQKKEQKRLDPKTTKTLPEGKYPSYWTSQERRTWEKIHGDNDEGLGAHEKGGKVNKDCGGAVAKFKMHRKGGILNRIPFIRMKQ